MTVSSELLISIDGVRFSSSPYTPDSFLVTPKGFQGWDSGVAIRRDVASRPLAVGSFDAPGYPGSRTVTIDGTALASSPAHLAVMRNRLVGVLSDGSFGRLEVAHMGEERWGLARLDGTPEWETRSSAQGVADFQIQFWMSDPRKYGDVQEFTRPQYSTFSSHHRGNTTASPLYVIAGDFANGYELRGPSDFKYRVTIPVQPGYPHTIDMLTGLLRVGDSVATTGGIEIADTWRIPSGGFIDQQLAPIGGVGSGTVTAFVTDTFI
jgi:hypothetical protein